MSNIPDYILAGHINLHTSQWCAAQFVTYVNYALDNFTMDDQGNFSHSYLKPKRKIATVTQWSEMRQRGEPTEAIDSEDDDEPDNQATTSAQFRKQLDKFVGEIRKYVEAERLLEQANVTTVQ